MMPSPRTRARSIRPVILVLLSVIGALVLFGCSFLREESIVSGKRRPVPEAALIEGQVTIQARPTGSRSNNGFEAERVWGPYNDWEPAIAIDRATGYVYQLTTRYDGPEPCKRCAGPYIIFRRSGDGGETWEADQFLTPFRKSHNDPQIEVAGDGTIYAAWLNDYVPGVKFVKSGDCGMTWTVPITIITKSTKPNWSDKPVLAVSANGRDVYIGFNASDSFVVASHNYGATFSRPVKTNNDKRYWFHTGGTVAPDGKVYFAVTDYSFDYTGDAHINILKSSNGGATWSTIRVDTSKEAPPLRLVARLLPGLFRPLGGSGGRRRRNHHARLQCRRHCRHAAAHVGAYFNRWCELGYPNRNFKRRRNGQQRVPGPGRRPNGRGFPIGLAGRPQRQHDRMEHLVPPDDRWRCFVERAGEGI